MCFGGSWCEHITRKSQNWNPFIGIGSVWLFWILVCCTTPLDQNLRSAHPRDVSALRHGLWVLSCVILWCHSGVSLSCVTVTPIALILLEQLRVTLVALDFNFHSVQCHESHSTKGSRLLPKRMHFRKSSLFIEDIFDSKIEPKRTDVDVSPKIYHMIFRKIHPFWLQQASLKGMNKTVEWIFYVWFWIEYWIEWFLSVIQCLNE